MEGQSIILQGQMESGEDEERNLEVNEVMDKVEDFEEQRFFFVGLVLKTTILKFRDII